MRIQTLLIVGTVISGAVMAAVTGALVVTAQSLSDSLAKADAARRIITTMFEQTAVLDDYLLYPGERARIQWENRHAFLGRLLGDAMSAGGNANPLLANMQVTHGKMSDNFARLREALEGRVGESPRLNALNELEEHRVAQIRLASHAMLSLATQLARQANAALGHSLAQSAALVAVLVASIVIVLAGTWFLVGWRVVRPIGRLQQRIQDFTGGRFDTSGATRADDEINDVARAFQKMTENLTKVMVSREELAKEVETRRQAEQQAREYADSLRKRSSELAAVNRELETFAYSVSHDLRAPLRSMTGFCQALVEDYGERLDATGKDYVRRISAASRRMGQLIDDLLALSRVTRTDIRRGKVDLSGLARTIAEQLRQAEPGRDVEFKIQPDVVAEGDETLLRTALENLIGNAWKYSAHKPHATIEFGTAPNGAEPTYYVRDDGIGFDMAHADKLFKPFQRLHSSTEFDGTGIGLASVANIVRRHGGRIWAESRPGAGTTMRFTL